METSEGNDNGGTFGLKYKRKLNFENSNFVDETCNIEGNVDENQTSSPYIHDKVMKIMVNVCFRNFNWVIYNVLQTKMGYQNGLGLGKNKQGIIDPVSFFANPGKCGFGLQIDHFNSLTHIQEDVKFSIDYNICFLMAYKILGSHYWAESRVAWKQLQQQQWGFIKWSKIIWIYCNK